MAEEVLAGGYAVESPVDDPAEFVAAAAGVGAAAATGCAGGTGGSGGDRDRECVQGVGGSVDPDGQFKVRKSGLSGKEGAKDAPSWVLNHPQGRPFVGESPSNFAKRLMDERYGPDNYPKGGKTEYNRIQKFWRAFEDPPTRGTRSGGGGC